MYKNVYNVTNDLELNRLAYIMLILLFLPHYFYVRLFIKLGRIPHALLIDLLQNVLES